MSPCQSCGACCATYRVTFDEEELDDVAGGWVPRGLTSVVSGRVVCMRGTEAAPIRCVALGGKVGEAVSCRIYESRPSSCREFAPLAALGRGDDACNEARRRHHLPPLNPA